MTLHKVSYIKIFGWIGAVGASIAAFIAGDWQTAVGIIGAASASSNLANPVK